MPSTEEVISRAVDLGDFGPGPRSWRFNKDRRKGKHYASFVEFIVITSGDKDFHCVVKIPPQEEFMRRIMHSSEQFETEVRMYKMILKKIGLADNYPKFYFGQSFDLDTDCVILEDWTPKGYKVSESSVFQDLDHILAGVSEIARFHAGSYAFKIKSPKEFADITRNLLFTPFGQEEEGIRQGIILSQSRGLKPLHNELADKTLASLQKSDFMKRIMKPVEPWTLLCHGDCNSNNMLFRYDDGDVTCCLFDFQLSRLSSPVLDLSFFLYLNTNQDLRVGHWDAILRCYWNTLSSICPEVPDFDSFLTEFSERSVYGYFLSAYFLPFIMFPTDPDLSGLNKSAQEKAETFATHGGDEATEAVVDIARHLLDKGYLQAFLNSALS